MNSTEAAEEDCLNFAIFSGAMTWGWRQACKRKLWLLPTTNAILQLVKQASISAGVWYNDEAIDQWLTSPNNSPVTILWAQKYFTLNYQNYFTTWTTESWHDVKEFLWWFSFDNIFFFPFSPWPWKMFVVLKNILIAETVSAGPGPAWRTSCGSCQEEARSGREARVKEEKWGVMTRKKKLKI